MLLIDLVFWGPLAVIAATWLLLWVAFKLRKREANQQESADCQEITIRPADEEQFLINLFRDQPMVFASVEPEVIIQKARELLKRVPDAEEKVPALFAILDTAWRAHQLPEPPANEYEEDRILEDIRTWCECRKSQRFSLVS